MSIRRADHIMADLQAVNSALVIMELISVLPYLRTLGADRLASLQTAEAEHLDSLAEVLHGDPLPLAAMTAMARRASRTAVATFTVTLLLLAIAAAFSTVLG